MNMTSLLISAIRKLKISNPLRLAGATAFFTTFALPPLFIIFLQLFGLVMNKEAVREEMIHALSGTIGTEGSMQVKVIMQGMTGLAINPIAGILGFIFLLFVATTLFKVIKDSIDELWEIKVSAQGGVKMQLFSRFKSLLVIAIAGSLFIGSILFDGVQTIIGHYIQDYSGNNVSAFLILIVNKTFSLLIATVWFTLLFRNLPDAITHWRVAATGGLVTGVLFTIGKVVLRMALPYKDITSVFGAAGSFVLVLLFVFYCSFILYYGACFVKVYADFRNEAIKPRPNAFSFEIMEKIEEEAVS